MNCPNCGAPLEGDKCGYCGFTLLNIIDFEPGKVCCVKMRYRGKEFTAKMYVENINVEAESNFTDITLQRKGSVNYLPPEPTLRLKLELVSVRG